jgi:PAS domain S-box-containing protein
MTPGSPPGSVHALVVTADSADAAEMETRLTTDGRVRVTVAETVDEALRRLETAEGIECILSDHDLPDVDGVAFLQTVRAQHPDLPFILRTGDGSETVASKAIHAGVTDYLIPGQDHDRVEDLPTLVDRAVAYYRGRGDAADHPDRARTILEAAPDGMAIVQDGAFVYVNAAWTRFLGGTDRASVAHLSVEDVFPSGSRTVSDDRLAAIQAGDRHVDHLETRLVGVDDIEVTGELYATRITWQGDPAAILIVRDISERLALEAELNVERELIEGIFDTSPIAKVLYDAEGTVLRANERAEELLGLGQSSQPGQRYEPPAYRLLDGDGVPPAASDGPVAQVLADGEPVYDVEQVIERPDGERRWLSVNVGPLESPTGEMTHVVAAMADVTEQKRLEREIRESERVHRLILSNISDTVLITDDDGRFTYVCPNVETIFGYSVADVEAMETVDALLGEAFETAPLAAASAIENLQHEVTDASGGTHIVLVSIKTVSIGEGTRLYTVRDITRRKRQERGFRAFVEHSSDVITVVDEAGTVAYASPSIERAFGYTPMEIVGGDVFDLVHPDDRERVVTAFRGLLDAPPGTTRSAEYRSRTAAGDWRWTESRMTRPPRDVQDEYIINTRDVTARVEREQKLADLEESRSMALEAANAGVWEWNLATDDVTWDESCERLFGLEPGTFEGTYEGFAERVHPDDLPDIEAALSDTMAGNGPFHETYRIVRDDGVERWVDGRGEIVTDDAGEPERLLGVDIDVTERHQSAQQLRVLDRILRHNIRNDLSVISGFAETIQSETDDTAVAAAATRIVEQSGRLLTTAEKERAITEILTTEQRRQTIDVVPILESVTAGLAGRYPDASIDLESPASATVSATPQLETALEELLENAVVHNDSERPVVDVHVETSAEAVLVRIDDNGPAIPEMESEVVTGEEAIEPLFHGSGLGLWLVAWIVRHSEGTLRFEENEPRGNRVTVRLTRGRRGGS